MGIQFGHNQEKGIQFTIERDLRSTLSELEKHQQDGRFPSVQMARKILNDETFTNRVSSLFSTGDLFYNPSQPLVSKDAIVVCDHLGNRWVAIYANRRLRNLEEIEFRQKHLMPLADLSNYTQNSN